MEGSWDCVLRLSRFLFGSLARRNAPQSFDVWGMSLLNRTSSQEDQLLPGVAFRYEVLFLKLPWASPLFVLRVSSES